MKNLNLQGKKVTVHGNGEIFFNGQKTNLKQWQSSPSEYSNLSGQVQSDVSGKTLEEALYIQGFLHM